MTDLVLIDRQDAIVTLTLNNSEKMNAFSQAMRDRLSEVLAELNGHPACRAIVLTGSGTKPVPTCPASTKPRCASAACGSSAEARC
jgi:enoyl-CoA hydratase/carnithine racemase